MRTLLISYREKTSSLNSNLNTSIIIKFKHNLVFQNMKSVGYFVVWTANDLHVEANMFDNELWDKICASAKDIMLPTANSLPVGILHSVENTTAGQNIQPLKKCSNKQDSTEEVYCYCCQVEH
ncbi:hypothetical protein MAR_019759 [Mya arenaria]|uniref:Uncharacterized protein n=1 Tax=Mya arenaria TaxID=6604 RepID=A0ABY7E620_MYAAR|nr:hypothetical protein MAR_019759 [Mya arenaria]